MRELKKGLSYLRCMGSPVYSSENETFAKCYLKAKGS